MVNQIQQGTIVIPHLEPDEARQTLRVRIAPDANDSAEVQHLSTIVAEWGKHMARAHLSRTKAEFSLCQVLSQNSYIP